MFPNYLHRALFAVALAAATLFSQGANATPPQCTLTASPQMVVAGATSTLTASCSPSAASFEWSGGTCSGVTGSSCTVTPSATTSYSVFGVNAGGSSPVASTVVFASGPYDGIYLWDQGYFLSVHRIGGDTLIGTIYWVYTANPVQVGSRVISQVDSFDLLQGKFVGSSATISGIRFFRACTLSYDLTFNADASLTVHLNSVSNSPGVSAAEVDCAARYPAGPDRIIYKIF